MMRAKILLFFILANLLLVGCASRKARLEAEYDRLSKQETALKEERKKMVNLENAIQDTLKAKQALDKRYKQLETQRNENYQQGQPLGPNPPTIDSPYEEQLQTIKINYESITKQIDSIVEEKKRVVEEQYK